MNNVPEVAGEQLPEELQVRLTELESVIQANIEGFFKVGYSLREIRDSELYRVGYETFEAYCQERWELGRATAYKQISAIETIETLKSSLPAGTDILPTCERQVRPLTKLPPKKQVEVWEQVICEVNIGEKLTSGLVSRMIRETLDYSTKKSIKKMSERVDKEERYSMPFRKKFNMFLQAIAEENQKEWKETSRESLLHHLRSLLQLVIDRDL